MVSFRLRWNVLLLSAMSGAFLWISQTRAEEQIVESFGERVKILQMVADQVRANRELLHTWKGRFAVEDESQIDGQYGELFRKSSPRHDFSLPIVQKTKAEVQFAVDADANALFTTMESTAPSKYFELQSGRELTFPTMAFQQRSIATDEHFLFLNPNHVIGQINDTPPIKGLAPKGERVAFRQEPSKGKNRQSADVVDPRLLFAINGEPISKLLEIWAAWSDRRPQDRNRLERMISVKREGLVTQPTFVITITRGPKGSESRTTFISKSELGFNLAEFTEVSPSGVITRRCTWSYRKQGGMYVPESFVDGSYNEDGKTLRSRRSLKLSESDVNTPLDKQSFTYAALGLKAGERVFDEREKAVYVFDGKGLVMPDLLPADKFRQPLGDVGGKPGIKSGGTLICVGLLVLLMGILAYRKYRAGATLRR